MPKSETTQRDRTAIIFELARHAHPSWYHSILNWPTSGLRALLAYYESEKNKPTIASVFCVGIVGLEIKR